MLVFSNFLWFFCIHLSIHSFMMFMYSSFPFTIIILLQFLFNCIFNIFSIFKYFVAFVSFQLIFKISFFTSSDIVNLDKTSSIFVVKLFSKNVTTDVLVKICNELKCNVSDIMEFVPNEESEENI